jgi:phage terminase large subunit GpA-like protein
MQIIFTPIKMWRKLLNLRRLSLTAEQLVTRIHKGYPRSKWQKMRERNEALDCRIYARAAAIAIGIDRWSEVKWNTLKPAKSEPQRICWYQTRQKKDAPEL